MKNTTDQALFAASALLLGILTLILIAYAASIVFNYAIADVFNLPTLDTRHAFGILVLKNLLHYKPISVTKEASIKKESVSKC